MLAATAGEQFVTAMPADIGKGPTEPSSPARQHPTVADRYGLLRAGGGEIVA